MSKIIYLPLEHIDSRYTSHLDRDILEFFHQNDVEYIRLYPNIESPGLKPGMFLDANFTIKFKSEQMSMLSDLYQNNMIGNDDIVFFSDLWFPGIESIPYMNHFNQVFPKIRGIIHAGSFTDTDEVRKMERWAKGFEDIIFDICDRVYLGSEFIKKDLLQKRMVNEEKLIVTQLPLDFKVIDSYKGQEKENIIIFNGRNHPEKQPYLFKKLKEQMIGSNYEFIWTQELNLNKEQYYNLLAKSKFVISFALQENFGYGIQEAVELGCYPILPKRLAYQEQFGQKHLYNDFDEIIDMIKNCDFEIDQKTKINNQKIFETWIKN